MNQPKQIWEGHAHGIPILLARIVALENAGPGAASSVKAKLISGDVAGDHTITGLLAASSLVSVLYFHGAGFAVTDLTDLVSEFTVTGDGTITNTNGTDTSGGKLLVLWS